MDVLVDLSHILFVCVVINLRRSLLDSMEFWRSSDIILRARDCGLKSAGVELEEERWKERRDGFEQAYSPGVLLLWVSGRYIESLTMVKSIRMQR